MIEYIYQVFNFVSSIVTGLKRGTDGKQNISHLFRWRAKKRYDDNFLAYCNKTSKYQQVYLDDRVVTGNMHRKKNTCILACIVSHFFYFCMYLATTKVSRTSEETFFFPRQIIVQLYEDGITLLPSSSTTK